MKRTTASVMRMMNFVFDVTRRFKALRPKILNIFTATGARLSQPINNAGSACSNGEGA